jgi:hypothetical protein
MSKKLFTQFNPRDEFMNNLKKNLFKIAPKSNQNDYTNSNKIE